jgi:hypothetical protein
MSKGPAAASRYRPDVMDSGSRRETARIYVVHRGSHLGEEAD